MLVRWDSCIFQTSNNDTSKGNCLLHLASMLKVHSRSLAEITVTYLESAHSGRFSISELRWESERVSERRKRRVYYCMRGVCLCMCVFLAQGEWVQCLPHLFSAGEMSPVQLWRAAQVRTSVRVYFMASYFLSTAASAIHALPRLHSWSVRRFTQSRPLTHTLLALLSEMSISVIAACRWCVVFICRQGILQ